MNKSGTKVRVMGHPTPVLDEYASVLLTRLAAVQPSSELRIKDLQAHRAAVLTNAFAFLEMAAKEGQIWHCCLSVFPFGV